MVASSVKPRISQIFILILFYQSLLTYSNREKAAIALNIRC